MVNVLDKSDWQGGMRMLSVGLVRDGCQNKAAFGMAARIGCHAGVGVSGGLERADDCHMGIGSRGWLFILGHWQGDGGGIGIW